MAVDIPQGTGGRANEEDGGGGSRDFPKPPQRDGFRTGDLVRKDGYVWEWNAQSGRTGWRSVRETTAEDMRKIPHARDFLDDPDNSRDFPDRIPDWANEPARGGGGGGGRGGGGGGGGGDGIKGSNDRDLAGVPGGARLWKVGGDHFVVYDTPHTDPPVFMSWAVKNKAELDRLTRSGKVKPDRTLSPQQFREIGALRFGDSRELANNVDHPWIVFNDRWRANVKVKPWLRDPELLAVHAASWLEKGADPSIEELQATDWWQSHTPEERAALERYNSEGRRTLKRDIHAARAGVRSALIEAGFDFDGNRSDIVGYFARELVWGRMTEDEFRRQVEQVSNPYATGAARSAGFDAPDKGRAVKVDGEVFWRVGSGDDARDFRLNDFEEAAFGGDAVKKQQVRGGRGEGVGGFGQLLRREGDRDPSIDAVDGYDAVRELVLEEAGPLALASRGREWVAGWAQRIAENKATENELRQKLRAIRRSLYPGYDDEASYGDIKAIAASAFMQRWGRAPKENTPLFQKVMQTNDAVERERILIDEGLRRGVGAVQQQFNRDTDAAFGDDVVGAM